MLKKTIFITFILTLTFSLCVIPSSAMGISNNLSDFSNDNRLWTPERYSVLVASQDGTLPQYTGALFPVSPLYKVALNKLPQTSYVNITSTGDNAIIPEWSRYLYHTLATTNIAGIDYYSTTMYLTRRDNAQTTDITYTQVDFSRFYIDKSLVYTSTPEVSTGISVELREIPSHLPSVGVRLLIACEEGDALTYVEYAHTYTAHGVATNPYWNYVLGVDTLMQDALAYVEEQGYEPYIFGTNYLVRSLSISGYSFDGTIRVRQPIDAKIRPLGVDDVSMDDRLPNFGEFLLKSISAFFTAPLFELGSFKVTLGAVFSVPLVLSLLIAFLKKFAGG